MAKERVQFEISVGGYHPGDQIEVELTDELEGWIEEGYASIVHHDAAPREAAPGAAGAGHAPLTVATDTSKARSAPAGSPDATPATPPAGTTVTPPTTGTGTGVNR
jgi:hypothetical protein